MDRRISDMHLDAIDKMITEENDGDKRQTLVFLQSLTRALSSSILTLEKIDKKLEAQDDTIEGHQKFIDKIENSIKLAMWFIGLIHTGLLAVMGYGLIYVIDMSDRVYALEKSMAVIQKLIEK